MASAAVSNLVVSLGVMQIARKIPFENPQTLQTVQAGYVAAQLFCFGIYYYTTFIIKKKNDKKVLKYTEPAKPMSQEGPTEVSITVKDYDLAEVTKAVRGLAIGIAIMAFMHFYMKYTQPLFIQSILPVKGLYDSKILQIHILGRPATGDLARPFAAPPSPFAALAGGGAAAEPVAEAPVPAESKKAK